MVGSIVNFDVVDTMPKYGANQVVENAPAAITLTLLSRLIALIASGKYGLDPNLADWTLAGERYGEALWGDMVEHTS